MTSSNISKNVLLSANSPQVRSHTSDIASSSSCDLFENRLKFEHSIDYNIASLQIDAHKKRLRKLRKELNYLQETSWKYQNIEKILGQN